MTAAVSPSSLPQSSTGRLGVKDRGRAFVATPDQFQEVFGGRVRELPHAEVIDNEEGHGREISEQRLAGPVERGIGDLLDQGVGFTIAGSRSDAAFLGVLR